MTVATSKARGTPSSQGRSLRIDDVIATTGLSRATIYREIKAGQFPRQKKLARRAVGWDEVAVAAWHAARFGDPETA